MNDKTDEQLKAEAFDLMLQRDLIIQKLTVILNELDKRQKAKDAHKGK